MKNNVNELKEVYPGIESLISMTNTCINAAYGYLEGNMDALERMDLKLHDISYPMFKYPSSEENRLIDLCNRIGDENYQRVFESLCEDEYRFFIEWMDESKIEDIRHYIGRSSSFRLVPKIDFTDGRDILDMEDAISLLLQYNYNGYPEYDNINVNGLITIEKIAEYSDMDDSLIEEIISEMEYIRNNIVFDIEHHMEDALLIYGYIRDFKDNQVETMISYIENALEDGWIEIA